MAVGDVGIEIGCVDSVSVSEEDVESSSQESATGGGLVGRDFVVEVGVGEVFRERVWSLEDSAGVDVVSWGWE